MTVELNPITSGYSTGLINDNFQLVEDELNNNVLRRDGLSSGEANHMEVNLDMNGNAILNVSADITDDGSLLNLGAADLRYVEVAGDTMSGVLSMGGNSVTNLPVPTQANEAARKSYVDSGDSQQVSRTGDSMSGDLDMDGNDVKDIRTTITDNLILGGLPVSPGELNPNQVIWVDTIADLQALPTSELVDGQAVDVAGGTFRWSAIDEKWLPPSLVSVMAFGAAKDGETNDALAFKNACEYAFNNGCGVLVPGGEYVVSDNVYAPPVDLIGEGVVTIHVTGRIQMDADEAVLPFESALSAETQKGSSALSLIDASGVSEGDILVALDPTDITTAFGYTGSPSTHKVSAVSGNTVTLAKPAPFKIHQGADVKVYPPLSSRVSNISWVMPGANITQDTGVYALVFNSLDSPKCQDCRFYEKTYQKDSLNNGIYVQYCYDADIQSPRFYGVLYGVTPNGSCGTVVRDVRMHEGRHPVVPSRSVDTLVDGIESSNTAGTLDAHIAFGLTYRNVTAYNETAWSAVRGLGVTLENIEINGNGAATSAPQMHRGYLTPEYTDSVFDYDLYLKNVKYLNMGEASMDITEGGDISLDGFTAPGLELTISSISPNRVSTADIINTIVRKQGGSRLYHWLLTSDQDKLDAVIEGSDYVIDTPGNFVSSYNRNASCKGTLVPYGVYLAADSLPIKIKDNMGYGEAAYYASVQGILTLILKTNRGVARKRYGFRHKVSSASLIEMSDTPFESQSLGSSVMDDFSISGIAQSGVSQAGADRFEHFISFNLDLSLSGDKDAEVAYELDLYGLDQ